MQDFGDSTGPDRASGWRFSGNGDPMKKVLILGAGFAGLELATVLSDEVPDEVEVTIVDSSDAFVFGFSKLDLMFGRTGSGRRTDPLLAARQARGPLRAGDHCVDRPGAAPGRHECRDL